ncbi:MAG: hypothetical protein AVDCRST_MAG12-2842, partial [uncultured Rubrobacteraceae bacterium]
VQEEQQGQGRRSDRQGHRPRQGGRRLAYRQQGQEGRGACRPGQGHPQEEEGRRQGPTEV